MLISYERISAGNALSAVHPAAATSTGVETGAAAGFQKSSSRAPRRFLASVCSFLKSFNLKQAAKDVLAVLAALLFVASFAASVLFSVFILLFVALE